MKKNFEGGLRNLPNLDALLQKVEAEHVHNEDWPAADARRDVVAAAGGFCKNRFRFGAALHTYREGFVAEGGWMAAVKVIADAIGVDESTVRRVHDDLEESSSLPPEAVEELESRHIDPGARKNKGIIQALLAMDRETVVTDAKAAVDSAVKTAGDAKAAKKAKRAEAVPSSEPVSAHGVTTDDAADPVAAVASAIETPEVVKAERAAEMVESAKIADKAEVAEKEESVPLNEPIQARGTKAIELQQRRQCKLRAIIGDAMLTAVYKLPREKQAAELIAALEELLYVRWDKREPFKIRPHAPAQLVRSNEERVAHAAEASQEMEQAA